MNEGSGQWLEDSSGNDFDAQVGYSISEDANDTRWGDGIKGRGIDFDGVDDFIILNPMDFPTTEVTVAFWIKTGEDTHMNVPISYAVESTDNEFVIYTTDSDLTMQINGNLKTTTISITDGSWHHIAATWRSSDGSIVIYKDGKIEYTDIVAKDHSITPGGSLVLGYEQDEVGGGFQAYQGLSGSMDEFILLDRYVSSSEISDYYNAFQPSPSNLITYTGDGMVDLLWDEITGSDFKQYNVYRIDPEEINNGLLGEYYNNSDFTDSKLIRFDPEVDFNWYKGSPAQSIDNESYCVRWTGYVKVDFEAYYKFHTLSDDGVRLWIDGKRIIDDWRARIDTASWNSNGIILDKGFHSIRLEYFEDNSLSNIELYWESDLFPKTVISSDHLFAYSISEFEKVGSVSTNNFRDTGLKNDESYFYYINYETNSGGEGCISSIVGVTPTYPSTIQIKPTIQTVTVGATAHFEIWIKNEGSYSDWFDLSIDGLNETWYTLSEDRIFLFTGLTYKIDLYISVPADLDEASIPFEVGLYSVENDIAKFSSGWMNLITDPIIHDLFPYNEMRTGSTDVHFSWMTDVQATTEVYIKKSTDDEYTKHDGEAEMDHYFNISDLERLTTYEFYVRSTTDRGASQSEVRKFHIDVGVIFLKTVYEFKIDRNYGQLGFVRVKNVDDKVHTIQASIDGEYDDFIFGFTGHGSSDRIVAIQPGVELSLVASFHAQDAMSKEYWLNLNLTTFSDDGSDPLQDFARAKVVLNHLFVNLSIIEIASNPYTLAKTLKITNMDDPITDLRIFADDIISTAVSFDPIINHGELDSDEFTIVNVTPQLHFFFESIEGKIFVSAYDREVNITLKFEPPEGWEVFAASIYPNWGGFPFVKVNPDDIDIDGIANIEDLDIDGDGIPNEEDPYDFDTDNDGFINYIDLDDDGDGNPDNSDLWRIDYNNNWIPNYLDPDRDGDGLLNDDDEYPDDHDNDGINNGRDDDDDNDRVTDGEDFHPQDHDNDGEDDATDTDDDDDGLADSGSDSSPMDQDNDGNPDNSDSDWKGGGQADPKNPTWNPNPSPGGASGSWGGGGGSSSVAGEAKYCPNDPKIDLVELLIKLLELAPAIFALVAALIGGPVGWAALTAFIYSTVKMGAQNAAKAGWQSHFGQSWTDSKVEAAHYYLKQAGWETKRATEFRGMGCRSIRDNVGYYYPGFMENTSRSANSMMGQHYMHYYWHEKRGEHSQIYYMKMDRIIGEPIENRALTSSSGDCYWPDMTTDGGNRLFLTWVDHRDGNGEIYFKMSADTGINWNPERRLTNAPGDADDPSIVMDSSGRLHLTWADIRDGSENIYYMYSDDFGNHWSTEVKITDTLTPSQSPQILVDNDDYVHIVCTDEVGGISEIFHFISYNSGVSWSSGQVSNSGVEAGEPDISISAEDNVHIVWRDSRHGESEIYYRKGLNHGSSWEEEVRITDDASYSEYPNIQTFFEDVIIFWHDDRTGMDLQYFRTWNETSDTWDMMKRVPNGIPSIDSLFLDLEMHPAPGYEDDVQPHDVYLIVNGQEVGSIINFIPDGTYQFEIPLEALNLAASDVLANKISLYTTHMNPGQYSIVADWKLSWHFTNDYEYICAPDQYTADEYLRRNMSGQWTTEDPAIYANNMEISDQEPTIGDVVEITSHIFNPGGNTADDVEVRFFADNPDNASMLIGDTIVIDTLGQYKFKTVSINWTAAANITRIYCVVDGNNLIDELNENNNQAYIRVTVLLTIPPDGEIFINQGSQYVSRSSVTISFDMDSVNEVEYVSFSNDNTTWSDWKELFEYMNWDLDMGLNTRGFAGTDGIRTLYVKFKDAADLISEVRTAEVEIFHYAPTILTFSPNGTNVTGKEPIAIEFSNPMNNDTVRISLIVEPTVDGSFQWEGRTLYYSPVDNWTMGQTYNVSITGNASDIFGRKLPATLSFNFTVIEGVPGDDDDDDQNATDSDNDGIPDWWEDKYGLNKTDPSDALEDFDNDTYSNLDEFEAGTDPTDPDDYPDKEDSEGGGMNWLMISLIALVILAALIIVFAFIIVKAVNKPDEEGWEE